MKHKRFFISITLLCSFFSLVSFVNLNYKSNQSSIKSFNKEIRQRNISLCIDTGKSKGTYHAKDSVKIIKPNLVILYGQAVLKTEKFEITANKIIYDKKLSTLTAFDYSLKMIGFDRILKGKECQLNIE